MRNKRKQGKAEKQVSRKAGNSRKQRGKTKQQRSWEPEIKKNKTDKKKREKTTNNHPKISKSCF
jgi:hypothetical protein